MRGRHVAVVVRRPPEEVYAYASDPLHLPAWAAGLAEGTPTVGDDGELTVSSPMGRVRVRFVPANSFGVLDHVVTLPDGAAVLNPLRVLAHPEGSEVVFTVRQTDGDDDGFERDCAMVAADLDRLRGLLEGGPGPADVDAPPARRVDCEVTLAGPADAGTVARMFHAFNTEFGAATPPEGVVRSRLERRLGGDAVLVVVARTASSPADAGGSDSTDTGEVGFGLITLRPTLYSEGPLAQLEELYVRPGLRSGGVGTALMERALAEVRSRGAVEMHLDVDADDTAARRFYARHGFSDVDPDSGSGMRCYLRQL